MCIRVLPKLNALLPCIRAGIWVGVTLWATACVTTLPARAAAPDPELKRDIDNVKLFDVDQYRPGKRGWFGFQFDHAMGLLGQGVKLREGSIRESVATIFKIPSIRVLFTAREEVELTNRMLQQLQPLLGFNGSEKGVQALRVIADTLMVPIGDRLLASKNVESAAARKIWVERVVGAYKACLQIADNLMEADRCTDKANASAAQNVGLAVVHEVVRSKVASSIGARGPSGDGERLKFRQAWDANYRACIGTTPLGDSAADVTERCALRTVRGAIQDASLQVLHGKLVEKLDDSQAEEIEAQLRPKFERCVQASSEGPQFERCIDQLVVDAGARTVAYRVAHELSVVPAIPKDSERQKYGESLSARFRACMDAKLQAERTRLARRQPSPAGTRNANGILEVGNCAEQVESTVTLLVANHDFGDTAEKYLGSDDPSAAAVANQARATLNKCWKPDQSAAQRASCVRQGVIVLAQGIASRTMEAKTPAALLAQNPSLKATHLSQFGNCLNRELPADITNATRRDQKLSFCTAELIRSVATPIAEFKVRAALQSHMGGNDLDALVAAEVKGGFARCLGTAPSSALLDRCTVQLVSSVSKQAGQRLIPAEVEAYLAKSKTQLSAEEHAALSTDLNRTVGELGECLDKRLTADQARRADTLSESCFKEKINDVVSILADLQYGRETSRLYEDRPETQREIKAKFIADLNQCVGASAASAQVSLDDHVKKVFSCADASSVQVTRDVGQDQLQHALTTYFKDSPAYSFARERDRVNLAILPRFKDCLSGVRANHVSEDRARCVERMQRQMTELVVLGIGRAQVQVQLGRLDRPQTVAVERAYSGCVRNQPGGRDMTDRLDGCIRTYILNLTNEVARLKVNETIKETFGTKEYATAKAQIDEQLQSFAGCLDHLKTAKVGLALVDGVNACAEDLQADARDLIRSRLKVWLSAGEAELAAGAAAKRLLVEQLPCLDALIPSTPVTINPVETDVNRALGGDVDGTLQGLARMFKDYIDYDALKADHDLDAVLKSIAADLRTVGPEQARERLVETLIERGAMDQFIKSFVRGGVADSLDSLPQDEKFSAEVRAKLLQKGVYEELFRGPAGQQMQQAAVEQIVKPVLIEGKSLAEPALVQAKNNLRARVAHRLADMPAFGDVLIQVSIQRQMDDLGAATRLFARVLYGSDSLKWAKVRMTPKGREAETYIRDQILKPKMVEGSLSKEEEARRMEVAKEMVTKAVKS